MGALLGVDDLVERVVKALKRAGVYRNTDIIFTSDNGWILGEHRLHRPDEPGRHGHRREVLPLRGVLARAAHGHRAGLPGGRTVKGLVVNADLAPTIEDITGAQRDAAPGRRLAAWPRRASRRGSTVAASCSRRSPNPRRRRPYQSIRTERYRYDRYTTASEQLYDLRLDPGSSRAATPIPATRGSRRSWPVGWPSSTACKGKGCRVDVGRLPAPGG